MFSEADIRAEYDRLDKKCGADTSRIPIVISARSVRRLGCFSHDSSGNAKFTVSACIMNDRELFLDTIRHEYAHALVWLRRPAERHGHDAVWRAACREVGCVPKGTTSSAAGRDAREEKARYIVRCMTCGKAFYYLREGKVVSLLRKGQQKNLHCPACNGNRFSLEERGQNHG